MFKVGDFVKFKGYSLAIEPIALLTEKPHRGPDIRYYSSTYRINSVYIISEVCTSGSVARYLLIDAVTLRAPSAMAYVYDGELESV